jgi:hypothetical protein
VLVIASETPFVVGERKVGTVTDANLEWRDATFIVVREATRDEYLRSAVEHGASQESAEVPFDVPVRYWAIATD